MTMYDKQGYENFITSFEKMSPFELDYFTKILCDHFSQHELVQALKLDQLRAVNLKDILINAMRTAHIEIAEKKVNEAQRSLDLTRSRVYLTTTKEGVKS